MNAGKVDLRPDELKSRQVRDIYDYWKRLAADRPAPARSEIDPAEMPREALPHVMLVDIEWDPFRVRYRLVGTHCVEMNARDYTGIYLDASTFPASIGIDFLSWYRTAAEERRPVVGSYLWPMRVGGYAPTEFAILPLIDDGVVKYCLAVEHVGPDLRLDPEELL